jgi:hypothetical protein
LTDRPRDGSHVGPRVCLKRKQLAHANIVRAKTPQVSVGGVRASSRSLRRRTRLADRHIQQAVQRLRRDLRRRRHRRGNDRPARFTTPRSSRSKTTATGNRARWRTGGPARSSSPHIPAAAQRHLWPAGRPVRRSANRPSAGRRTRRTPPRAGRGGPDRYATLPVDHDQRPWDLPRSAASRCVTCGIGIRSSPPERCRTLARDEAREPWRLQRTLRIHLGIQESAFFGPIPPEMGRNRPEMTAAGATE